MSALAESAPANLIEMHGLKRVYELGPQQIYALSGVDLIIENGEYVAIMGPSGSGKSTLMNIIGCLDRPTDGQYLLDGTPWRSMDDDELAASATRRSGSSSRPSICCRASTALQNVELPLIYANSRGTSAASWPQRRWLRSASGAHEPPAQRALRRPAPARGHRPGPGQRPVVPAGRRAHRKPRLQDRRRDPRPLRELHNRGNSIIMVTHEDDVAHEAKRIIHIRDGKIV